MRRRSRSSEKWKSTLSLQTCWGAVGKTTGTFNITQNRLMNTHTHINKCHQRNSLKSTACNLDPDLLITSESDFITEKLYQPQPGGEKSIIIQHNTQTHWLGGEFLWKCAEESALRFGDETSITHLTCRLQLYKPVKAVWRFSHPQPGTWCRLDWNSRNQCH